MYTTRMRQLNMDFIRDQMKTNWKKIDRQTWVRTTGETITKISNNEYRVSTDPKHYYIRLYAAMAAINYPHNQAK